LKLPKVVCLIQPEPALYYFVNRIGEVHDIALVIIETPKKKKQNFVLTVKSRANSMFKHSNKKYIETIYNKYFNSKWQTLDKKFDVVHTGDINSESVFEKLKKVKPDVLLDHGTTIVKDNILDTARLALNLHWGLSPYYRGSYCTEWALINWDPYNIGVTIHKLSKYIDGGEILAQQRAEVQPDDTTFSINMQLTKMGTELVIEAITKLKSGEELKFKKQDFSKGFITLSRQRSKYVRKQIKYIEQNHVVEQMLEHPARKDKLPIVKFRN